MKSKKARLAALITAGALTFSASPALAQVNSPVQFNTGTLISILNNPHVNIQNVELRVLNVDDTLNNVNVRALNNFLNNSLNNNVNVLRNFLNNNVDINDVVDVIVEDNTLVLVVDVA